MPKRRDASLQETTELCGEPYEADDPQSPRCVVRKNDHSGRPHEALNEDGSALVWPLKPDVPTPRT